MAKQTHAAAATENAQLHDLSPYFGKHVAWNLDRTVILTSGDDDVELVQKLDAAGLPLDQAILSYVPFPDEIILGGVTRLEARPQ